MDRLCLLGLPNEAMANEGPDGGDGSAPSGEPQGLEVASRVDERSIRALSKAAWTRGSPRPRGLRRGRTPRCTCRLGADAEGQDQGSGFRRTGDVCLDLPFHGSHFEAYFARRRPAGLRCPNSA